jgi:hypothetical protein
MEARLASSFCHVLRIRLQMSIIILTLRWQKRRILGRECYHLLMCDRSHLRAFGAVEPGKKSPFQFQERRQFALAPWGGSRRLDVD